jgi:predicted nucleotidyltransferase
MTRHILLEGIVGSTAYGFATATSDIDRLGMFAVPTVEFLGLGRVQESVVRTNPDRTLHEALKWCRLAMRCNPTASELVWLPDDLYEIRTELGEQLIMIRDAFLSAKYVRDAYLGYASQQLRKLELTQIKMDNHESPEVVTDRRHKHARHLVRLVQQGIGLHTTGFLEVRLADPQRVIDVGAAVVADPEAGKRLIYRAEKVFDAPGVLPQEPDTDAIEGWLLDVRRTFMGSL